MREDTLTRPELCKGTVDFVLPSPCTPYWAPPIPPRFSHPYYSPLSLPSSDGRVPQMMNYVLALDVSRDAIENGFLASACEILSQVLGARDEGTDKGRNPNNVIDSEAKASGCWPRGSQVAIITFDRTLHFYRLGVRFSSYAWSTFFLRSHFISTLLLLYLPPSQCRQASEIPPPVIILPDIDEPFAPFLRGLFVDPYDPLAWCILFLPLTMRR